MAWCSQAGQDRWVIETLGPGPGYFVDCGAHDGLVHSNTWSLECDFGWTGLCIEPNAEAYSRLRENRRCWVIPDAVSDHGGSVMFNGVQVGSGTSIPCEPLATMLTDFDAPAVIDYLSVDVEGHELEVLAGMDFDRWTVRLITIEHNLYVDGPARKDAIFEVLTGHGFERVVEDVVAPGYGAYECWYQHI